MFRICSSKCQNEVKELNAFCEKLLSEKAGWGFEKNTMMRKLKEKENRNIEVIKENMDYREQIARLEKKVKEIETLENKIIEKDSIIAMLEDRLSIFEDEFCQYREVQERTINGLNDKLNRFRKHKKAYKNKWKEKVKEYNNLLEKMEECKVELTDLYHWYKEMENCTDYYVSENKELKEENEKLIKEMKKTEEELKRVEEEMEYKKQQYVDEFHDYDNEMTKMENEIIELESKVIELESKEQKKEDIKNVAYNTIMELRKEINDKDASIKELTKTKENLTLRERHLEEVNYNLMSDMSAKDEEIEELRDRVEQLEETLSVAIEEINAQVSYMEDNL